MVADLNFLTADLRFLISAFHLFSFSAFGFRFPWPVKCGATSPGSVSVFIISAFDFAVSLPRGVRLACGICLAREACPCFTGLFQRASDYSTGDWPVKSFGPWNPFQIPPGCL